MGGVMWCGGPTTHAKEQNQQGWSRWLKLLAQKGVSRFTIFRLNNDKRLLLVLFSVSSAWPKARANRKLNKADVSHSLGSEQELMASARRHHHHQLHHRRETQDDDPVMKKKRILTYINCCIRPN
ncbi:PREDICTED: uncharacterized protein LOC106329165 isoform X1 [Brassica oleracea var. oleracea]|uniref:uncharacterized protein LOC106329165 isoform X1 n=1 Tax=Brassica oleracea var. oleracea TaxID=109376 RepID=UPI0006A6A80A|nr:PREDICTED: uncharacterized protein LOC106329165 isoform X1 [Brassica oleracea var. oleracea]